MPGGPAATADGGDRRINRPAGSRVDHIRVIRCGVTMGTRAVTYVPHRANAEGGWARARGTAATSLGGWVVMR